jgi:nitroimidazol reductase NimA-like FMN-containing flavoprotein (pyridoxamine 5'-phosphate oxidase superfamily)
MRTPSADLDTRYSEPEAEAPAWDETAAILAAAELSWITTVRSDGTPHVTPLITVVHEGTAYFCTGPDEQKARNLRGNPAVALTTGTNALHGGTDVVLEGRAERVTDDDLIAALIEAWVAKYGEEWRFEPGDGAFKHPDSDECAWVFAVRATRAYAFGKAPYSQTRWTF